MVDIHNHFVWGVDDGPQTRDESHALMLQAVKEGISGIVATPHKNDRYSYPRDLIRQKIADLSKQNVDGLKIYLGCELLLCFDNLNVFEADPGCFTLNGKQYLLVEFPNGHLGNHIDSALQGLLSKGFLPIIAHPERYAALQKNPGRLNRWVQMGCLAQVTALSITGGFGRAIQNVVFDQIEKGLIHVVASDVHSLEHRPYEMKSAFRIVCKRYGEEAASLLFSYNPTAVIEGTPSISLEFMLATKAKWYQFWKTS